MMIAEREHDVDVDPASVSILNPTNVRITRQTVLQQVEAVDDRREQEVERPQPHHGEDVRRVDDERIRRHAEDGGNRVDREDRGR